MDKRSRSTLDPVIRVVGTVHGRVQGVGFRAFAQRRAVELGLVGSVANRDDGAVRFDVQGLASSVDKFLSAIGDGPAAGRVDHVRRRSVELDESRRAFSIEFR